MKRTLAAILMLGLLCGAYADTQATEAINAVAESIECPDSTNAPDGWTYTFRLTNPSRFDVDFNYYVEIFIGPDYITTLDYTVTVPAQRSMTVEARAPIGDTAREILLSHPDPTFSYKGQFEGRALWIITKSWTNEWSGR